MVWRESLTLALIGFSRLFEHWRVLLAGFGGVAALQSRTGKIGRFAIVLLHLVVFPEFVITPSAGVKYT